MTKYIGPKTADENVATQADKLSLSSATPDALTPDQAGAAGTATTAARSDHQHEILAGAAGTILPDDVAAEGTASSFARSDHTHSIATAAPGTITPDAAAAEGSSNSFARADHTHAIAAAAPATNLTASTTNAEGTSTSFARADHSHAISTGTPGSIQPDDSASAGTSADLARADHRHAIAAASAGTITGTNAEGTSTSFARADHNHALGPGVVGTSQLADGQVTSAKLGLTSLSDTPSSNTTFNASSGSTDVTGLSITCAAGSWLIIAHLDVTYASGTPKIEVWNYTDSSTIGNQNFLTGFSNPSRLPISLMRFTTFTDNKSVTIRMSSGSGTSNFTIESAHTTLTAIRLG